MCNFVHVTCSGHFFSMCAHPNDQLQTPSELLNQDTNELIFLMGWDSSVGNRTLPGNRLLHCRSCYSMVSNLLLGMFSVTGSALQVQF